MVATRTKFETMMQNLRDDLLHMGFEVEALLQDAVVLLARPLPEAVEEILRRDDIIDLEATRIEEQCLRILTMQQPLLATDLRTISMYLKAASDLERIGDHAVNIARTGTKIASEGGIYRPLADIPLLAEKAGLMVHDALEAIIRHDVQCAEAVIAADDEVDALYRRMRRDLQQAMLQEPSNIVPASHLMFVVHYLERIGDHSAGIAERVLYRETGDLRHLSMSSGSHAIAA